MITPKFKVGDKVRIREDLKVEVNNFVNEPMLAFRGKIFKIIHAFYTHYLLEKNSWHWIPEMFDPTFVDETNFKKDLIKDFSNLNFCREFLKESLKSDDDFFIKCVKEIAEKYDDKSTPTLPFQVGDICEAFGLECVIEEINATVLRSITVRYKDSTINDYFLEDGRYLSWHKTPSLKLIKRPEPVKVEEKKEPETKTITRTKKTLTIDSDILEHYKQKAEENGMSLEDYMNGVFKKITENYKAEKNKPFYEWKYKIQDSQYGEMITPHYYKNKKELKEKTDGLYSDAEIASAKRIARLKRIRGER